MSRQRIAAFIMMYVFIVIAMLVVYFSVQREYGADPERPYQRRFFIQLPLLERADSRFALENLDGVKRVTARLTPVNVPL